MITIKSITGALATININVDGTIYVWTVGGLSDVEDIQAHLDANADLYRADIRTALEMGREVPVVNERQDILDELAQLDLVLPRAVEDLVEAMQILSSLPEIMQERIARKSELRNKLKELV